MKASVTRPGTPRRDWPTIAVAVLFWCGLAVLLLAYLAVGDRTAWGEYLTVWPPILWAIPLGGLAVLQFRLRRPWPLIASLAGLLVFCLLLEEWRPLLRGAGKPRPGSLRVMTWNLNEADFAVVLRELEPLWPDVCCFQESPGHIGEGLLMGPWAGYGLAEQGETTILSRYPMRALDTERVGPWSPPQLVLMDLPSSRTLLVANVRLMLPSLVLNPLAGGNRKCLVEDHGERVKQYPELIRLIEDTAAREGADAILLAGDFNIRAGAPSLRPIRKRLRDAWLAAGHGWGRTMTADFPVARIDQVYVTPNISPLAGEVRYSPASDHRMVMLDIEVESHFPANGHPTD